MTRIFYREITVEDKDRKKTQRLENCIGKLQLKMKTKKTFSSTLNITFADLKFIETYDISRLRETSSNFFFKKRPFYCLFGKETLFI